MLNSPDPVPEGNEAVPPRGPVVLAARDVSFAYGAELVLEQVSLEVRAGEFAALAGPNGSGKSTLLRILLGLMTPQAGAVTVFGTSPHELPRPLAGGVRASAPAHRPRPAGDGRGGGRHWRLAKQGWWRRRRAADRDAVDHALQAVALTEHRRKRLHELSGGQQQRALIARALSADPELLVLDEPIAGVDVESQQLFRDSLVHLSRSTTPRCCSSRMSSVRWPRTSST